MQSTTLMTVCSLWFWKVNWSIPRHYTLYKMFNNESSDSTDELTLPTLFKTDKNNKERYWKVHTVDNTVYTEYGQVNGQPINKERQFEGNRNINGIEQAKREAEKRWISQLGDSYKPVCKEGLAMMKKVQDEQSKSGGHNLNTSTVVRGRKKKKVTQSQNSFVVGVVDVPIKPMKAHTLDLDDNGNMIPRVAKYINFVDGVFVQPKYDGWRCMAREQTIGGGSVVLTTNNLKQYPFFGGIREQIRVLLKEYPCILDGELYAHTLHRENSEEIPQTERFSTISGICSIANKAPHPLEDQMEFHVFDIVDLSSTIHQTDRFHQFDMVKTIVESLGLNKIKFSPRREVFSLEDAKQYHDQLISESFEGIILRAKDLTYSQNRNLKLRKYKNFYDIEATVIGVEKSFGVGDEMFVFVTKLDNGIEVKAKPSGTEEYRKKLYKNSSKLISKRITLKYQEYSQKGVPRFPVTDGIIREDK